MSKSSLRQGGILALFFIPSFVSFFKYMHKYQSALESTYVHVKWTKRGVDSQ